MKKILLVLLFSFSAAVQAEELKFVTVLSSPVGTFNRVEEVDSQTPVTSPVINFCTKRGSGNVQLNGRGNPAATTLNLASDAELGGNASEYRLQTLTMRYGGTLKGSRLLANTVNANTTPTLIKSSDIYASTLNVQGAKTEKLNVGNGKSQITQSHKAEKMVWSNEHQQDKNGTTSADYAKQFLLKSQGTPAVPDEPQGDCSDRSYKLAHKSKCCPGTPYGDTDCWQPGGLKWCYNSETKTNANEYCAQLNMYDPGRTCRSECTEISGSTENNASCWDLKDKPCSNIGEICYISRTWCPKGVGTDMYGKPICDCKGNGVLNKVYVECAYSSHEKVGW